MSEEYNNDVLFEATAVNENGIDDIVYIDRQDGMRLIVSNPLEDTPGTNPEELFGLAQSTCLNSTIQALLRENETDVGYRSKVKTKVTFKKERLGYYFDVTVYAGIENISKKEADRYIHAAERRCPVSKLVSGSDTVTLNIVNYEDI